MKGIDLTPEERRRIYEEESVRISAQQKLVPPINSRSRAGGRVAFLAVGVILITFILLSGRGQTGEPATTSPAFALVGNDYEPCGSTPGEVAETVQAAKESDILGLMKLGTKAGNHLLRKGDKVEIITEDQSITMSNVRIAQGEFRDDRCWTPRGVWSGRISRGDVQFVSGFLKSS